MGQIQVTINGRSYAVACEAGQEPHVGRLARYIERKVSGLVDSVGQVGDARLLLMASLIIADELSETEQELDKARQPSAEPAPVRRGRTEDAELAQTLDGLTDRINAIAARLEGD